MISGVLSYNILASGWLSAAVRFIRSAALVSPLVLAACAQTPTDPEARAAYDQANDPAEPTNRTIFAANQWVDRNALQPAARAYEDYVPNGVRKSLRNFTLNLKEPSVLVNDTLQANFTRAWTTTQRFAVNTTVGGAGLFDVATDWDLLRHDADFGQTFGVWGMGSGPSVQLPLLGPSNVRDATGMVAGFFANPLGFVPGTTIQTIQMASMGVGALDQRAAMLKTTDELEKTSFDYYATLRSMQAQRRAAFVEEGRAGEPPAGVNIGPVTRAPAESSAPDILREGQ